MHINPHFKRSSASLPNSKTLYRGIVSGEIAELSKAITLLESSLPAHAPIANELLELCLAKQSKKQTKRIGITGIPGVGKSTFLEHLGMHLCDTLGEKIAILAVDPSSAQTHGSILGDKTRMQRLANHKNAFIRPTPSSLALGGVARRTKEVIILCEAFGFDTIFIETVGVGQSEIMVREMVDCFVLLSIPGAGDELQGIKRGIMEMADCIVMNKADGDALLASTVAKKKLQNALHFFPAKPSGWTPTIDTHTMLDSETTEAVWSRVKSYFTHIQENSFFSEQRSRQNVRSFERSLEELWKAHWKLKHSINHQQILENIRRGTTNPYRAAQEVWEEILRSLSNTSLQ